MELRYKIAVYILSVNLFFSVSIRARNVSEVFDEQIRNETQTFGISTEKSASLGFENKTFYQCDCGFGSSGCSFYDGKITCYCKRKYVQNNDKCELCDCGHYASKCYFEDNKKVCTCIVNYKQNNLGECEECDCGYNSESCEFSGFSKKCTCKSGYLEISGKCETCSCGAGTVMCWFVEDEKVCLCNEGYAQIGESCEVPVAAGWKTATIVLSVFLSVTLVAFGVTVFKRKFS